MDSNSANLQLSPEEMRLVSDPGWILTKNSIVAKVVGMMAGLADAYREVWYEEGWSPKISRGENYRGLPWVMLDYPRVFGREDVLAIRTFFWWGQGWNVILHLKGAYRDLYLPVILERWQELEAAGFHVGVHSDEWRHEHTDEVYRPFSEIGVAGGVRGGFGTGGSDVPGGFGMGGGFGGVDGSGTGGGFLKLSAAVTLDRWMEVPELLAGLFGTLVGVLKRVH